MISDRTLLKNVEIAIRSIVYLFKWSLRPYSTAGVLLPFLPWCIPLITGIFLFCSAACRWHSSPGENPSHPLHLHFWLRITTVCASCRRQPLLLSSAQSYFSFSLPDFLTIIFPLSRTDIHNPSLHRQYLVSVMYAGRLARKWGAPVPQLQSTAFS